MWLIEEIEYEPIEELVEYFYFMRDANEREVKERRELTERIQRVEELVDVDAVELDKGRDHLDRLRVIVLHTLLERKRLEEPTSCRMKEQRSKEGE